MHLCNPPTLMIVFLAQVLMLCLSGITVLSCNQVQTLGEKDWQQRLSAGQYRILRRQGTEPPFSSGLHKEHRKGVYRWVIKA